MEKLQFYENKTLKLTNVLTYKILLEDENFNLNVAVEQMQTYIRTKGAMPIGPLIQYSKTEVNEQGELDIEIYLMMQCNHEIHHVDAPYQMECVIRVQHAAYCRYHGMEQDMHFAYDKIQVEAFERDIILGNQNYTIFVDQNEEEETMTVDVFVPRK